ncbi:MAG: ABC transporter substrate-binding protein [Treponema sp.]|nr:ABC transporter substrate-binding protein [Treponema sp.]
MRNRLRVIAVLALVLALGNPIFAGGGKQASPASPSSGAADVSGKLVIYTSIYEDVIEALDKALEKKFPKADIEFFYGGTGALQAKIAAEIDAGKLGCDLLLVAEPSYSLELKEKGMLHPYVTSLASRLAFDYDKEGYWYPVRICNMVLAYNPEKVAKNSIPNSLRDFAFDSSVKGLISMGNPLTSGTTMAAVTALRDKYGYEYFQALGNQGVKVESGSVALTKLQTGECKVIMILEESILKVREEDDSKLEVIYPTDGTIIIPSTVMSIAEKWSANKNTKLAEALTDWLLSDEGQENIVKGWMHSPVKDFPTLPYDGIPTTRIMANQIPVNWENVYRQREEIRTRFEEYVTKK